MNTGHTILFLSGLLLLAIVVQPLARKIHVPFTATLVIAGFIASESLVMAGIDTGVRADSFHDLIFFVFLPVLIFESAYTINAQLLWKNLFPILFLAIPFMLLSTSALPQISLAVLRPIPWM